RPLYRRRSLLSLHTTPPPRSSPLLPYTTLFRSLRRHRRFSGDPSAGHTRRDNPWPPPAATAPVLHRERGSSRSPPSAPVLWPLRSEEHTSELQSLTNLVCRLLLDKK